MSAATGTPLRRTSLVPVFSHLQRLTDAHGLHEHARHDRPRHEHGYCTDDVARALIVVVREPHPTPALRRLARAYLRFVENAVADDGSVHNRRSTEGGWADAPSIGDWWGRALAALGATARRSDDPALRRRATAAFLRAARRRSPDVRASAFAVLGAVDMLHADPACGPARSLLVDALDRVPWRASAAWGWPEARLRYANGALCEARIAGGSAFGEPAIVAQGLRMLAVLLQIETADAGHLSVTGTAGRGPGERGPLWDQQAIEPAAIADACATAYEVTGDRRWLHGVDLAADWFAGRNDARTPLYDPLSGAGYDGLTPDGRNDNRGAESTLAALSTLQRSRDAASARP